MPKEQSHSGEFTSCSSSKNAKEKSNCATLRASLAGNHRNLSGMGDMSKHMLCCDSEKDSGYSGELDDTVDDMSPWFIQGNPTLYLSLSVTAVITSVMDQLKMFSPLHDLNKSPNKYSVK